MTAALVSHSARGRAGEQSAAAWLAAEGWEILERNFRLRDGEIDIIASRQEVLAFVEVKCWSALPASALEYSIDYRKQARIVRAARVYLARHPFLVARRPRFDVLFLDPASGVVRHIEGAFEGGMD